MLPNLADDIQFIESKLDSALVGARVAEKAALDAAVALRRLNEAVRRRAAAPQADQLPDDRLNVTPKEACRLLSCGVTQLYEMIGDGRLDSFKRGRSRRITMESIRRQAGPAP